MTPLYHFGDFVLDSATRELRHAGDTQVLPPRMFECLRWLIEHRDRAVGRDELLAAVWGQVDADPNVVAQVIARLRRLIDIHAGESLIRTVPHFGYRWLPPTRTSGPAAQPMSDEARAISVPRTLAPAWRVARWATALVSLLVISASPMLRFDRAPERALVLPAQIDADAGHEWMRLGLMALAIERLRSAGQAVVPADNVVAATRDMDSSTDAAPLMQRVALDWPRTRIIGLHAREVSGRWRVDLTLNRTGQSPLQSGAEAEDALEATREAVDRMAALLGHDVVQAAASLSSTLLQAEAASLADEPELAFALLEQVDAASRETPEYRYQRAWAEYLAGSLPESATDFRALLADLSATRTPVLRARALNGLANVQYRQGDIDGQRASAEEAIGLLQHEDAPTELGRALTGRAVALVTQGHADEAQRDFQLARVNFESGGDRLAVARSDLALGIMQKHRGRFAEARKVFQDALFTLNALHDVQEELLACVHLVETHLRLLEPADALALEPRLRSLIERVPPSPLRELADLSRIETLQANGRVSEARDLLASVCKGDAADERCADHPWRMQLAAMRVRVNAEDRDAALREVATALKAPGALQTGRDPGNAWLLLLRTELEQHDASAADRVLEEIESWAGTDKAVETPVYASLARAETAAARGDNTAARSAYERALGDADANSVPMDLLVVAQSYVGWLMRWNDGVEARIVAGRVAPWSHADFDAAVLQLRVQHAFGKRAAWQSALARAQSLAGERDVPTELTQPPAQRPNPGPLLSVSLATPH
jgi:DNA-binding winged helix-turn-helix (wHTH) protein/tetratricopeptide (TPR) repeat protein